MLLKNPRELWALLFPAFLLRPFPPPVQPAPQQSGSPFLPHPQAQAGLNDLPKVARPTLPKLGREPEPLPSSRKCCCKVRDNIANCFWIPKWEMFPWVFVFKVMVGLSLFTQEVFIESPACATVMNKWPSSCLHSVHRIVGTQNILQIKMEDKCNEGEAVTAAGDYHRGRFGVRHGLPKRGAEAGWGIVPLFSGERGYSGCWGACMRPWRVKESLLQTQHKEEDTHSEFGNKFR